MPTRAWPPFDARTRRPVGPEVETIATLIAERAGKSFVPSAANPISGGSIHGVRQLSDGYQRYFVKTNALAAMPIFAAEARGCARCQPPPTHNGGFDPACYYGDRKTDIAMAELFGGFPPSFQAAYRAAWPLDRGYETRKPLCNLYHILNHFNLFGSADLAQARRMIDRLLAELRR